MSDNKSGYPVQEEIEAFMKFHGIESNDELLAIPSEELYKMEGITMHIILELYRQRKEKGLPD